MKLKSSLLPDEVYEVTNVKINKAPKNWKPRLIIWGGKKYLPIDD
jgi:hypothetical protein